MANFKLLLKARCPDVHFVDEEWPALGKVDALAVTGKLAKAKSDAIFNTVYGADLAELVRQGKRHGLLADKLVVSMLGGEPENLSVPQTSRPRSALLSEIWRRRKAGW